MAEFAIGTSIADAQKQYEQQQLQSEEAQPEQQPDAFMAPEDPAVEEEQPNTDWSQSMINQPADSSMGVTDAFGQPTGGDFFGN